MESNKCSSLYFTGNYSGGLVHFWIPREHIATLEMASDYQKAYDNVITVTTTSGKIHAFWPKDREDKLYEAVQKFMTNKVESLALEVHSWRNAEFSYETPTGYRAQGQPESDKPGWNTAKMDEIRAEIASITQTQDINPVGGPTSKPRKRKAGKK